MGKLIEANKEDFENIIKSEEGLVLVDFWAPWCGPCKMLGPILSQVSEETDVTVVKINVDENDNSSLAAEQGVRGIPAVFIYKGGEQVDKFVGAQPKATILDIINRNTADEK
jgi:thioredoxin 1